MVAGHASLKADQLAAAAPRKAQRLPLNPLHVLEHSRSMAGSASAAPLTCQLCSDPIDTDADDHIEVLTAPWQCYSSHVPVHVPVLTIRTPLWRAAGLHLRSHASSVASRAHPALPIPAGHMQHRQLRRRWRTHRVSVWSDLACAVLALPAVRVQLQQNQPVTPRQCTRLVSQLTVGASRRRCAVEYQLKLVNPGTKGGQKKKVSTAADLCTLGVWCLVFGVWTRTVRSCRCCTVSNADVARAILQKMVQHRPHQEIRGSLCWCAHDTDHHCDGKIVDVSSCLYIMRL
jgi:hypothetical protein